MKSLGHSDHCRCSGCSDPAKARPLLSLQDLTFAREERTILNHINFTIDHGDFIAITGPNGGGKTTLLHLILGLLKPTGGKVVFYDHSGNIASTPPAFGYLPQKNSIDASFPITVREVIASGLLNDHKICKADKAALIDKYLHLVGLEALAQRTIGCLSGGQIQRALLARALIRQPEVLILDEPLSYLDKFFEERLYEILSEVSQQSTILLVSHEMSRIAGMAGRHIIIDHGLEECTKSCHFRPEI